MGAKRAGRRGCAGALVLSGGVMAALASPALALAPGRFTGRSSQGQPVTLTVRTGSVGRFTIHWDAACRTPHNDLKGIETYHSNLRVTAKGWRTSGSYSAPSGNGYTEYFTVRDNASPIRGGRVRGVFSGSVKVVSDADTTQVYACHSGEVTFTLKRG